MSDSYTVTRHRYGVVVEGLVPITDMAALGFEWAADGNNVRDIGIAWHYRVNSVFTSKENSKRWRAEIADNLAAQYPDDKPMQWLYGCDVGASSCYLFSLLCDDSHTAQALSMLSRFTHGCVGERQYPRDADDWGRCVRMLDTCGWWDRLDEEIKVQLGSEWSRWWEVTL